MARNLLKPEFELSSIMIQSINLRALCYMDQSSDLGHLCAFSVSGDSLKRIDVSQVKMLVWKPDSQQ